MISGIKYIYFDLDNTILNHTKAEAGAQSVIFSTFDEFQSITFEQWIEAYKDVNNSLWLQYQAGETDRYKLQYNRFYQPLKRLHLPVNRSEEIGLAYLQEYRKHWTWVEGAKQALEEISKKYPVGIVTNGFSETQKLKIDALQLNIFTENVIITEEIGVMKPHPKVFDVATKRSKVNRGEILYVGDSYSSDIIGGKNAGWNTAWYTGFLNQIKPEQKSDFTFDYFPHLTKYLLN